MYNFPCLYSKIRIIIVTTINLDLSFVNYSILYNSSIKFMSSTHNRDNYLKPLR